MADLTLAQHTDAQQYRIPVAVGPGFNHLQSIAGALSLGPQCLAGAAVERHESSAQGLVQSFPIHKAHHQEFASARILNDSWCQALHLVEVNFHWILLNFPARFSELAEKQKARWQVVRQRAWISYECFLVIRCPPPTRSSHGDYGDGDGSAKSS